MVARLDDDFCFGLDRGFSEAVRERLDAIRKLTAEISADPFRVSDLDAVSQARFLVTLDEVASRLRAERDKLHTAYRVCCVERC